MEAVKRPHCPQSRHLCIDVAYAENGVEDAAHDEAVLKEQLKNYEEFGMVYDSDKDVLYYNGKLVRWFEDYYELSAEERGRHRLFQRERSG